MKDFQAGIAKADITPGLGTLLYGYPFDRPAEAVLDTLSVNALIVKQGAQSMAVISIETGCIGTDTCEQIAAAVEKAVGIKKENVVCAAIHTHSAPIIKTTAGWGDQNTAYIDSVLIPATLKAVRDAYNKLQPAKIGIGYADSFAGVNRREITTDGAVILGQNPQGPYNPLMTAVVFKTLSDEPIGSLVHFACHPTSAGTNHSVTRDWPGYIIDRVETVTGAPCMYLNGALGDVGPRLSNGKTTGNDSLIREIGTIAANDVEKAISSIKDYTVPELKAFTGKITLPLTVMPPLDDVLLQMEKMGDPGKLIEVDILTYDRLKKMKEMYDTGAAVPDKMELTLTVFSLGDLAFVPMPFEVFCRIALDISDGAPFRKALLVGLAGGYLGYIPTEDQLPYGGYEVDSFRAVTIPGFVDSLDKYLISESVKLLNKLHNQ